MHDVAGLRMTVGYALAIKRLYGPGIVRVASKHNLREIAAEIGVDGHIDAARIADNFTLRGPNTADGVAQLAKSLMDRAGVVKCRKTAVMALELLFTLPTGTTVNLRQYFEHAISWAERHFGVPVLSCIAHLDEGAPHAHALLLPLVDGRMGGSDLHGGKAKLWAMQTSFHDEVGSRFGLARQTAQKRLSAPVRAAAIELARDCLQANSALTDAIVDALLLPHAKDPEPLLCALGIDMPAPKGKAKPSFAAIMTAPCKPEPRNPIGKANRNPIGIAPAGTAPESQPYTCVGIGFPTAPIPHDFHHRNATADAFAAHPATEGKHSEASLPEAGTQRNEVQRRDIASDIEQTSSSANPACHLTAPAADSIGHHQRADTLLSIQEAPVPSGDEYRRQSPSTAGQPATTSANTAPAKSALAATKHQPASTSAPREHAEMVGLVPTQKPTSASTSPMVTVKDVQRLDGLETKRTNFVQLVEQHAAAARPQPRDEVQVQHPIGGPALDADDGYQRLRDDDRPAETWCEQRGEFVTVSTTSNRPAPRGRPARPPGAQGARASPADIALTSVHEALALASSAESAS